MQNTGAFFFWWFVGYLLSIGLDNFSIESFIWNDFKWIDSVHLNVAYVSVQTQGDMKENSVSQTHASSFAMLCA